MSENSLFARSCGLAGIEPDYIDALGEHRTVPHATRQALLGAMGIDGSTDAALTKSIEAFEDRRWDRVLPALFVVGEGTAPVRVPVILPAGRAAAQLDWNVELEDGTRIQGTLVPSDQSCTGRRTVGGLAMERHEIRFDARFPIGYHTLTLRFADESHETGRIGVVPANCYLPPSFERGHRIWGVSIQLYGLRSRRNWGIGDFSDLRRLVEIIARLGGHAIGLNPLHSLFPGDPGRASPYSPTSRRFANLLYLDVEAVRDFQDCAEARARVGAPPFQARLASLRQAPLVDYAGVAACKLEILEMVYRWFREAHLARGTRRAQAFRRFRDGGGRELELFGAYHALAETFGGRDRPNYDWRTWPESFRRPDSPDVDAAMTEHRERIDYFVYLAWRTEMQLQRAVRRCERLGMAVGIYQDLALGVDPGGVEAWMDQDSLAMTVGLGAPPDELNFQGQAWGLPPYEPAALESRGYEPFIATLRANMRHGGALRIDHVLGLARQFWVPNGVKATDGGYVRNALDTLIGLIALESHRNRCLVIGEDLGTVPSGFRERLADARLFSYRLLYFERDARDGFLPPERYPALALAAIGTHDVPTFSGWWSGFDLDERHRLDLFPRPDVEARWRAQRRRDRKSLIGSLSEAGLSIPDSADDHPETPTPSPALVDAVHAYLARTPSLMVMVHLEDALGVREQVNLPGTTDEHPNWQRKLPIETHRISRNERIVALARIMRAARPAPVES